MRAVERRDAAQARLPQRRRQPKAGRAQRGGGGDTNSAFGGGRGGVQLEPPTEAFPFDPNGPPVATFFEAGGNIEGGLPYTDWAREIRKQRFDVDKAKDNPDANCMPMGFLQFHQQPQPRKIIQTKQMILIEYEAELRHPSHLSRWPQASAAGRAAAMVVWLLGRNLGRRHARRRDEQPARRGRRSLRRMAGRQRQPLQPQAKFTERIRRPKFGQLQIDMTLEDPKAYTKPWTVRIDQRYLPDQELIEFVCNENQQFRRRIKID